MQKYKYIILFLFIKSFIYSQSNHQFSGKVVDEKNEPLSNVNVILKNSKKGTMTNSNGAFVLNYSGKKDYVTFSYIGYKSYSAEIDSTKKSLRIKLEPAPVQLPEVLVTNLSAEELLDKAILNIPANYPQEEYLSKIFYRASILTKKDSLLYVEETMFEQVKSYSKNYNDKTFLVKNRNFNFLNKEFGIKGIGIYDNVKSLAHKGRRKSKNVYSYGTPVYFDGGLTYVIEINKESEKESVTKGKIFVDIESLALIRFELSNNNQTVTTQYKKIGEKYYLFSQEINNQNETRNGGYGNVKALFVLTEINDTFNINDIKGTLVSEDEIIRTYANQDANVSFWKTHNSVLPDTLTQQKINKFVYEQGLSTKSSGVKEIEAYEKIYYPHLSLRLSTDIPNDINSLSQNSVSLNLLTNHLLQKKLKNFYLKLLVPSMVNVYLISPFEEIELERELLSISGLHTKMNPFMFNSLDRSYHYGLSASQLEKFKTTNYRGFMRLHTLRGEYHYLKTKILEEDIVKTDMSNRNNKYNYLSMYFMDLISNRTYNIFYSQLKDKTLKTKNLTKSPLIVDTHKSWVKYLFEQDRTFSSHIKSDMLTAEEQKYLKRSAILSWMNLISAPMLSIDKFPISENISATFSLNYLRIPFGEMTEQNVWIKYRRQLNGLFIRQYMNKEKLGYGIEYKMYNTKLSKNLSLTSLIDYWNQPATLNFYDNSLKSGFHVGQELECKFGQDRYSQQHRISFYIGYDYKTKGYLPENLELNKQFKVNFGVKVNM